MLIARRGHQRKTAVRASLIARAETISIWFAAHRPLPPYTLSPVTQGVANRVESAELSISSIEPAVERQPGARAPAPGRLRLVQSFVNSRWDLDRNLEEQLSSPSALTGWLVARGLLEPGARIGSAGLARALDVREGLRELLFVNNGATSDPSVVEGLNLALQGPGLFVQLDPGARPDFVAGRRDLDGALGAIATIVAVAQLDGSWTRLKACRGNHCGWAFYDHSRNQGSSWCAMSVCGQRAKARTYRSRRRKHED
jgi:predicted RNA-binding Zn ribbon-like protein